MIQERKIHSGLVGTLLLLSALIVFSFHTRTAQQNAKVIESQIAALQAELQGVETTATGTSTGITETLSEVEKNELSRAIPPTIGQDQIINDLYKAAKAADVSFNALNFNLESNAALPTVNITGGFQGASGNILRFLKMVESNPRKLLVKDAGVSKSESVGGLELVNLNVTLQAFYR
ncbi:hypothetical protein HZA42_00020 [Candidatus Peregrinibacteria bacterium]|nr:hypothetical protein [Candidatus Peregrinibacteria bacterium]